MTFRSLASSSAGNAYLVTDGETTLLLECGLTLPRLKKLTGFTLSAVGACFVTHEHQDHAHAAGLLIKQGIPVYMSEGTARALELPEAEIIDPGVPVAVGGLRVMAFRVWHDAKQPVGYLIEDVRTRERLLFAADTRNLDCVVAGRLTYIAVECNYDDQKLGLSQRINPKVRERIRHTHMDIDRVMRWLRKQDLSGVLTVWLLHLSDSHANEQEFLERFTSEFPGIRFEICKK